MLVVHIQVTQQTLAAHGTELQEWNIEIMYRLGESKGNADALSRQEWQEVVPTADKDNSGGPGPTGQGRPTRDIDDDMHL